MHVFYQWQKTIDALASVAPGAPGAQSDSGAEPHPIVLVPVIVPTLAPAHVPGAQGAPDVPRARRRKIGQERLFVLPVWAQGHTRLPGIIVPVILWRAVYDRLRILDAFLVHHGRVLVLGLRRRLQPGPQEAVGLATTLRALLSQLRQGP